MKKLSNASNLGRILLVLQSLFFCIHHLVIFLKFWREKIVQLHILKVRNVEHHILRHFFYWFRLTWKDHWQRVMNGLFLNKPLIILILFWVNQNLLKIFISRCLIQVLLHSNRSLIQIQMLSPCWQFFWPWRPVSWLLLLHDLIWDLSQKERVLLCNWS